MEHSLPHLQRRNGYLPYQAEAFQAALTGASLETSLHILIRAVHDHTEGMARAAFYRVDGKNRCLRPINVANGMPEAYQRAVDGFRIGPRSLACGLAIYTGRPVITPDVGLDPAWHPWRAMAEQFDYRGCWSFPVHTPTCQPLGTFAMYYQAPRKATLHELKLARVITQTAGLLLTQHQEIQRRNQAERALQESEAYWRSTAKDLEVILKERTRALLVSDGRLMAMVDEVYGAEHYEQRANHYQAHMPLRLKEAGTLDPERRQVIEDRELIKESRSLINISKTNVENTNAAAQQTLEELKKSGDVLTKVDRLLKENAPGRRESSRHQGDSDRGVES